MKKIYWVAAATVVVIGLLQLFNPEFPENKQWGSTLSGVPPDINNILSQSCFDCHSDYTHLRWYDRLAPGSFFVNHDIRAGRKALNFSSWDSMSIPKQNAALYYAVNKVLAHEMPLKAYTFIHPSTSLSESEARQLQQFALSRAAQIGSENTDTLNYEKATKMIKPSPNGIEYIPGYRNWKAISVTDRFDNGTMRIIYANDVATRAINNRQTAPWPNGSILAKVAWKQNKNANGTITPGRFIQVEFMIKDAEKFKSTEGWGWARWKGNELQPYGRQGVESECISCHQPVKKFDLVFTAPLLTPSKPSK